MRAQEFKTSSINKKLIKELENQIILWKKSNRLLTNERDTLKKQIKTYIEIKINLEGQIYIQEQKIDELSKNLEDYKTIENNLNIEIKTYKGKIKRKNGWITKLIITNIITTSLLIFILI
jgi:chromosome segregation ATPase